MNASTNYPRCKINERHEWYGTCYDLEGWTGPKKSHRVWLGRHDTRELAEAAFQKWKETGEKPPRRKYHSKHKERSSRVVERHGKFYAKGTQYTEQKRIHLHIGVYLTQKEAQEAADRFIATGERHVSVKPKRAVVIRPKKPKVEKPKREPKERMLRDSITFTVNKVKDRLHPKARVRKDGELKEFHIGSFGTMAEAEEAMRIFRETGERQLGNRKANPKKERPVKKEKPRRASIQEGITTRNGPTFYVTGRDTNDGKRVRVHVGTFDTRKKAETAAAKFIATGEIQERQKRGPKVRVEDIKIVPGRNLRDHEVAVLKTHRPDLVGGDPRARRPNESVGDWCRRLEVMKGYRAA